jgi:hypothetical protein
MLTTTSAFVTTAGTLLHLGTVKALGYFHEERVTFWTELILVANEFSSLDTTHLA